MDNAIEKTKDSREVGRGKIKHVCSPSRSGGTNPPC